MALGPGLDMVTSVNFDTEPGGGGGVSICEQVYQYQCHQEFKAVLTSGNSINDSQNIAIKIVKGHQKIDFSPVWEHLLKLFDFILIRLLQRCKLVEFRLFFLLFLLLPWMTRIVRWSCSSTSVSPTTG